MARQNRRRSRIVDAPAQARIVLGVTLVPMIVILVAAIAMWVFSNRLLDEAQQSNADLPSLGVLVMIQFVFVVATGAVVVIEALRHSHRVVGPAMRISRTLRRIREGHLEDGLTLRCDDSLADVAKELNALLEHLRAGGGQVAGGAARTGGDAVETSEPEAVEVGEHAR